MHGGETVKAIGLFFLLVVVLAEVVMGAFLAIGVAEWARDHFLMVSASRRKPALSPANKPTVNPNPAS